MLTKEDKIQVALGLKFICINCNCLYFTRARFYKRPNGRGLCCICADRILAERRKEYKEND